MSLADREVRVRVPATSANLGPGFDSVGLALSLHDVVRARVSAAGVAIAVTGIGARAADAGEDHLVLRAMRAAFGRIGEQPPGLSLCCANSIPQGFGLGSSAAAIVAGLLAARALSGERGLEQLPDDEVLRLAARLEGHADNVAACLAGGLTIAWQARDGFRYAGLAPLPALTPVLCLPDVPLATVTARQVLPATVPHSDAAQNAARAALLIAALTADPRPLLDATEDFLHQPYRFAAMPDSAALIGALRQAGVPAVISGAGPAVLALTAAEFTPGADTVAAIAAESRATWAVTTQQIDRQGATVDPRP